MICRLCFVVMGPPPPPLPPPFRAINQMATVEPPSIDMAAANDTNDTNGNANNHDSDELDSDSGLEVIEEPTLRPSELVRGNHNRTMSIISGKWLARFACCSVIFRHLPAAWIVTLEKSGFSHRFPWTSFFLCNIIE